MYEKHGFSRQDHQGDHRSGIRTLGHLCGNRGLGRGFIRLGCSNAGNVAYRHLSALQAFPYLNQKVEDICAVKRRRGRAFALPLRIS